MCRLIALGVFLLFSLAATFAGAQVLEGSIWTVDPDFKGKKARVELSGAVCAGQDNKKVWCLAVNDEKKTAQFFSIEAQTIGPTDRIRLLPKSEDGEIDAEGAAYDNGYVYVTGSHGLSRSSDEFRPSQFYVFRFPVNKTTGKPTFVLSNENVSSEIQRSSKLQEVIQRSSSIGPFAERPLDINGANIEGLAVVEGRIFFGFRGPSIDQQAFLIEVSAEDIFGDSDPNPITHRLSLGYGVGVRDLARVKGGLLVLSGHVNDLDIAPRIYFWSMSSKQLVALGQLPIIARAKAETLLVLDEETVNTTTNYRALVLYDGLKNGRPIEYKLSR